jgi:phosphinothricin acetyltransferase
LSDVLIRRATAADAAAIAAIYAPYVHDTAITFEEEAPSAAEMATRIAASPSHPWLVAERDGAILAYAYASVFQRRPAYRWSVETTVYVGRDVHRQGVGAALYARLLAELERLGYVTAVALIASSNAASLALHERFDFHEVGRWERIGFKLGAWHDTVILQRDLAPRGNPPGEIGRS